MERFKIFDHPSDVGILVFGKGRREVFENAAYGMFSLMADLSQVAAKEKIRVKVKAEDPEGLMVNWLNELIYLEDSKKYLFRDFEIESLEATRLEATIGGEKIDLARHSLSRPIKAATFNQLAVSDQSARIIFDV
jgi:SHS2 domain-containing protein